MVRWNYPQLEKNMKRGYKFKSTSDSEIILYLYKENELERLDGMFSFVIYDKNKLILSRDWVGKIPCTSTIQTNISLLVK